jgi:hypothetical protein
MVDRLQEGTDRRLTIFSEIFHKGSLAGKSATGWGFKAESISPLRGSYRRKSNAKYYILTGTELETADRLPKGIGTLLTIFSEIFHKGCLRKNRKSAFLAHGEMPRKTRVFNP